MEKRATWPGWETVRLIGRGSFGAVYEIQRQVFDDTEKAALKVISIPQNPGDIEEMYNDGYKEDEITSTLQSHLKSIVTEYSLMRKMNGHSNIVNCDDVRYIQHKDGVGWDIFIKMELLTPLSKSLPTPISEETVVKVARDMCVALELCQKNGIVHRDIKPQNIFVSDSGDYKLGDFGIAKTVERTMGGTKIGTYKYMAPEVYNNQPYGTNADIYSLGLVLYWMLNERRMPFYPQPPAKLSADMDEVARRRRFSGEPLPAPKNGSKELKRIVLKACAFDPKERYASATEMMDELEVLGSAVTAVPVQPQEEDPPASANPIPKQEEPVPPVIPAPVQKEKPAPFRKGRITWGALALVIVLLLMLAVKLCSGGGEAENISLNETKLYVEHGNRFYYIFDDPVASYEEAVQFCLDLGGHLADITSEDENAFVYEYLYSLGYDHVFLGGNDSAEDGVWEWNSGVPFEYQNWNEGEPNNDLGGEDYLAMYRVLTDGSWNDITFTKPDFQVGTAKATAVTASSYCADAQDTCSADHIADENPATAWCAASNETGIGEHILFTFEYKERLTGLSIYIGNQKNDSSFETSLHPKTIKLIYDDGTSDTFELQDLIGVQEIQFKETVITDSVKVVFTETFESKRGGSIAVSELQFFAQKRKTGFVCEWESEDLASAAMKTHQEFSESSNETTQPPETTVPQETLPVQVAFSDWMDELPDYVTAEHYVIEEQMLYSTQKLEKTSSTEVNSMEGWTLVDTISNLGEYGPWSEWTANKVSSSDTRNVEKQTRYRYKTKETTTGSSSSKSGWELYDTTYSWGDYGAWSGWSTSSAAASDTRQVEKKTQYSYRDKWTTQEYSDWSGWSSWSWNQESTSDLKKEESRTVWGYYYFQCASCGAHMPYSTPCETWGGGCGATNNNYWNEIWSPISWDDAGLSSWHGTRKQATYSINGSLTFKWDNGDGDPKTQYRYATRSLQDVVNYGSWSDYSDTVYTASSTREVRTRTVYRYRDRQQVPTYHFYRWGEWSAWSTKSVSETSERQVETKSYYRYQDKVTEITYCFERWTDWSEYSAEPAAESAEQKVQTKKQYRYRSKTEDEKRNPYTDIDENASNFEAVMWVSEKGIMNGTSAETFDPNGTINRGQMVMLLWRAAGKPAPTAAESLFKDVGADSPYLDAVLWATQEGIAGGESADLFGVDSPCVRGQAIAFLYRAAGKPGVTLSQEPFTDVNPGDFFYDAVLWAYANNVSSGISTTEFGVNANCTRMQVAVMLYRAFGK